MVGWNDSVGIIANRSVVFVVAEFVRVHRPTQLVGDAPGMLPNCFWFLVHDLKEIVVSRKDAKTQRAEERRRLFFFVPGSAPQAQANGAPGLVHHGATTR
jgi:hypothetical protein